MIDWALYKYFYYYYNVSFTFQEEEVVHYDKQIQLITGRNTVHRDTATAARDAFSQAEREFQIVDGKIRGVADRGDPIKVCRVTSGVGRLVPCSNRSGQCSRLFVCLSCSCHIKTVP